MERTLKTKDGATDQIDGFLLGSRSENMEVILTKKFLFFFAQIISKIFH